ncbi:MAG TPA: hypothetical protein VFV02_07525, partial [Acidimicrobiales bacterium]|nr:hypothetical protein [Acidimicrobiales bacterium]
MSEQTSSEDMHQPAAPGTPTGHTGVDVPVRIVPRPPVTESAVGTAPPSQLTTGETVRVKFDGREIETQAG